MYNFETQTISSVVLCFRRFSFPSSAYPRIACLVGFPSVQIPSGDGQCPIDRFGVLYFNFGRALRLAKRIFRRTKSHFVPILVASIFLAVEIMAFLFVI